MGRFKIDFPHGLGDEGVPAELTVETSLTEVTAVAELIENEVAALARSFLDWSHTIEVWAAFDAASVDDVTDIPSSDEPIGGGEIRVKSAGTTVPYGFTITALPGGSV